jgi:acyl carrier protein
MEQKLLEIINTVLSNAGLDTIKELKSEDDLRQDLGLDSINLADLTVRIDEAFGVDVFEGEIIESIGQLISTITSGLDA